MNDVSLIGRLTADPEVRYSAETQMAVASFTIAIDKGYGEKKKTNFIEIVCFGKTAESVKKYLFKGKLAGISGEISTGSYTNKSNVKVKTFEVVANRVDFLSPKDESTPAPVRQKVPDPIIPQGFTAMPEEDDDIPF